MNVQELWEQLETITDDRLASIQAVSPATPSAEVPPTPSAETIGNISKATQTLRSLIRENRFQLLPNTIQELINASMQKIVKLLIESEADETHEGAQGRLDTLTKVVESLMVAMWQNGLHNLPSDYYEFARKIDDIKRIEQETRTLLDVLRKSTEGIRNFEEIHEKAVALLQHLTNLKTQADDDVHHLKQLDEDAAKAETEAKRVLDKIKTTESETVAFRESANTSAQSTKAVRDEIQNFFEEITKYRNLVTITTEEGKNAITLLEVEVTDFLRESKEFGDGVIAKLKEETDTETERRWKTLNEIESHVKTMEASIKDVLTKATGYALFNSFNERRSVLVKSKWVWASIVLALFGLAFWGGLTLADDLKGITGQTLPSTMYLKFALSIPLAGAIWFALSQYSKERRLEEEYAFRSNVSVSLVPYKDEVAKLLDHTNPAERKEYADFVIGAIKGVYTSPTDKLYDGGSENPLSELQAVTGAISKLLTNVGDMAEKVVKSVSKLRE